MWRRKASSFYRRGARTHFAAALCCVLIWLAPAWGQGFAGVLTQHNDSARTGQNLSETILTPQNVTSSSFGKVFSYSVDGQIYAQPLYVPNVSIPNQATYNVVYVATENDTLYAFDADGVVSTPLWQVSFINPAQGITTLPCQTGANQGGDLTCNIYPEIGITGTPVIDGSSNTMYLVARTLENGVSFQRLHAIDITTGAEKLGGPVVIQASVPGIGAGSKNGIVPFDPLHDIQRTGLLLLNGNIYIGWAGAAHGWIMAYNAQTLAQTAVLNTTPNAVLGGVWQSGSGLATDDQGNIYAAVGDALFDANLGGVDYGDSLLKLGASLNVLDYFTPFDQACRKANDDDLGSGGPIVLPAQPGAVPNEVVIAGKGGSPCDFFGSQPATPIYLLNRNALGEYNAQQDQDVETVAGSGSGYWSSPAYWQGPSSAYLYMAGSDVSHGGDALKMYSVTNGLISSSPVDQSSNVFPTGSTPSLSANGNSNGIVWAVARQDRLFKQPGVSPAILYAYDATNVSLMLYSSAQIPQRDQGGCGNKFQTPTIANGKVYVGTQNELDVFGPLGNQSSLPAVFLPQPCANLGPQVVGKASKPKALTLQNSGSSPLNLTSIGLTGPAAGDYSQTNNCGSSVPAGGSCTILVTFTPSVDGVRSAFVTITDNAVGSPHNVALTGATKSAGSLTVTPSSLVFGNLTVGTSSTPDPVSVTNTGQVVVNITKIGITGQNAADFSQTNNCPASLKPGAGCQVNVTFNPKKKGIRSAALTLNDDAQGSPQSVSLSGKGVRPMVTLQPSSLTFPAQNVGQSSQPQTVTLKNTGAGSLFITSIVITGANSTDFSQTNNCGGTVPPGTKCTIQTTFTPTGAGLRTASIAITDNAGNGLQNVPLQGTGNASEVSLNPGNINFPDQAVGTSSSPTPVTLTNTGNQILTISSIASSGDFSQTNNCGGSVPVGANCTINVTFTPTTVGLRQGQVTVTDNAPDSPQAVSLSGNGVASAVSLLPGNLSFSNQDIFATSPQQKVTVTNVGSATLIFTSITASGDYQQTNDCSSSLPVGGSCSIYVTFRPGVLGTDNASATLNDNALDSPQTIPLSGSGVTSTISFSPSSLSFPTQAVGTTSPPQNLTLTNLASVTLNISSIVSSNLDFAESDNCIPSVPPGVFCTLGITFTPSQDNPESGTSTITDDAPDSPQVLSLSGNGTVPAVALSPANLNFGTQPVGTTSPPQTVTLTNVGTGVMNLATIIPINPDYAQTNSCPSSLNPGDSCAIAVTFTPNVAGSDPGTVSNTDDAPASPQQLILGGNGS